jgi:hypothetical protein
MKRKDHASSLWELLLAVFSAVSLVSWAAEEAMAIVPSAGVYAGVYAEILPIVSLALDACVLGIGMAVLLIRSPKNWASNPILDILSSAPVIVLASAPAVYARLEGTVALLPSLLLAARSLRILRLHRVLPGSNPALLSTLAVCEVFRSVAGSLVSDALRFQAALRLMLIPESLILLAAAILGSSGALRRKAAREAGDDEREAQVGQEELAGLLGKRSSW